MLPAVSGVLPPANATSLASVKATTPLKVASVTTTGTGGVTPVVDVAFPMVNIGNTTATTALRPPTAQLNNSYAPQDLRKLCLVTGWLHGNIRI